MPNAIIIRTAAPGAKDAATDLNGVKTSMTGIKTAGSGLSGVNDNLLQMSRNSRLLNREFRGVSTFAGALDQIAGTSFGSTIAGIKTIAEVADPLKALGETVVLNFKNALGSLGNVAQDAWDKVAQNSVVSSAASKAGAVAGNSMVQGMGAVAAVGTALVIAYELDQQGKEIAKQIPKISDQGAQAWKDSFLSTLATGADQAMYANSLQGFLGQGFQNTLDSLVGLAGRQAGAVLVQGVSAGAQDHKDELVASANQTTTNYLNSLFAPQRIALRASETADALGTAVATDTKKTMADAAKVAAAALANKQIWDASAQNITNDLAGTLQKGAKTDIKTAMDKVKWAIAHPMALAAQEARLQGAITTLQFKAGLASNSPEVNKVIDQQIAYLEQQWSNLTGRAYDAGAHAGNAWSNGYVNQINPGHVNLPGYRGNPYTDHSHGSHRAAGGPVSAGEAYTVGERGQETFVPNSNGTIVPNGNGVHVHVHLEGDAAGLFRVIDREQGRRLSLAPSSAYSRG